MTDRFFLLRRPWFWALLSVVAALLVVLVLPGDLFLSSSSGDIEQLASARAFAAANIKAGHFPLWNPNAYAGEPFLGDFQSAELYPPNLVFLILPLARAVNFSFLLHLLILAWGIGYWASRRGCHPLAAALAGMAVALSGPVFLRLYAGHLANASSMAWAPWMLLALESAWRGPALRPLLLAAAAACLQILGGHPQYVFYVAMAAGLHAVVQSVVDPAVRWRALPMVAAAYLGGAALAAAQLLPGFAAVAESVRQGPLDFDFVRMFSLPPENLLTLVAPGFFGDLTTHPYWGRCYLWEVVPFIGVAGLALVALGALSREHGRRARYDLMVAGLLLVLALGDNTPLLRLLYDHAPGFDKFRTLAKFTFPMVLFAAMPLAAGADRLIRGQDVSPKLSTALLAVGGLAIAAGLFLWVQPAGISGMLAAVQRSTDNYLPAGKLTDAQFLHEAGVQAGCSLSVAGILLAILGLALWRWPAQPRWRWVPLLMLPMEMFGFAHANFATARLADLTPQPERDFLTAHPGDYRILTPSRPDDNYFLGASNLWGNNPLVLKRYAEFIQYSQGGNPDRASQYADIKHLTPAFGLIRFGVVMDPSPAVPGAYLIQSNLHPLPRAFLLANYQVLPGRNAILPQLFQPDFDPEKIAYLESAPSPQPRANATPGAVQVTNITSDSLTIAADTPPPTLLLITDLYSRDWRARPLLGSTQSHYDILPADYIIRAIPLAAGHHHLVVEFAPSSFKTGLLISIVGWLAWLGTLSWSYRKLYQTAILSPPNH